MAEERASHAKGGTQRVRHWGVPHSAGLWRIVLIDD
jgi:hypothetical protein